MLKRDSETSRRTTLAWTGSNSLAWGLNIPSDPLPLLVARASVSNGQLLLGHVTA